MSDVRNTRKTTDGAGTAQSSHAPPQDLMTEKQRHFAPEQVSPSGHALTTNQGVTMSTTDHSLKAGDRGPTLIEDFHFREKMTHFDHERIPERVVHARGAGAHGYFQAYESQADLTRAGFLQEPSVKTPVFARFSTVAGSRGSTDTPRDGRGVAVKFYTSEGVFDLVANNIPVFFIQDAIKFPDVVHAFKPEAPDEIPQATAAHDTAWDFFSLQPETTHMVLWVMSDRGIPLNFRTMDGFGVHTFRMINAEGVSRFVKFHWKSMQGTHSLAWTEAQVLSGKDPDSNRRDLWDAIEAGNYPEWELGVQVIEEDEEHEFNFDILDPTKLWPEELVPVRPLGKMTLNRNPDNFFAETEQVAFHPGHLVPGIDVSDDPLLQGRLFSYLDTQLNRFGGTNFADLPINRSACPVFNNQQDGFMRHANQVGRANYFPNSIEDNAPTPSPEKGYVSHPAPVSGRKVRARAESFSDHFSQSRFFYLSQSEPEKEHLSNALKFELGKVKRMAIRERMVGNLARVDRELAENVAHAIGVKQVPDVPVADETVTFKGASIITSAALSMANTKKDSVKARKVAILVADGVSGSDVEAMKQQLAAQGAKGVVIAKHDGAVTGADGKVVTIDKAAITTDSVEYDAVYIPGGAKHAEALSAGFKPRYFVAEAFAHYKPIAANAEGIEVLRAAGLTDLQAASSGNGQKTNSMGVVTAAGAAVDGDFVPQFLSAIAQHRFWERRDQDQVPDV